MRIGYAKLGRTIQFDNSNGNMAGNEEAVNVLRRLATRNPEHEFVVVGKSTDFRPSEWPSNVRSVWPDGVSKAMWQFSDGLYRCGFCKTALDTPKQWTLDCCDRAREVTGLEEYAKACMVQMDAMVFHVGQHGIVHIPIPTSKTAWAEKDFATPYAWARNYGWYLIDGYNKWADAHAGGKGRVAWIEPDPRNFIKARDIKWPTGMTADEPLLSQTNYVRVGKHERYRDLRDPKELGFEAEAVFGGEKWHVKHHYVHCGLELAILPDDWSSWGTTPFADRALIGAATTAPYLPDPRLRRSAFVQTWLFEQFADAPVYGKWGDKSLADVTGTVTENSPTDFASLLASFRCTIALPPIGTLNMMNWTTAKPFQCFAARTACFLIPPGDDQGWILPTPVRQKGLKEVFPGLWSIREDWESTDYALAQWLRPTHPGHLAANARIIGESEETWTWIVDAQRDLLQRRWNEHRLETMIEERLKL